jgi:Subtilase family
MNRNVSIALVLFLAVSTFAATDEDPPRLRRDPRALHYLITTDHVVQPGELEAAGAEVQSVLPGNRYLVRAADAASLGDARGVRAVQLYSAREKISRDGLRAAASNRPFITIRVVFHEDTTFDAALAAVEAAGGTIETPLDVASARPQRLEVRIPPGAIARLARSEAVFAVYGRPFRMAPMNDKAASLSEVTPLYSAPYNLDGTGVVLSIFEVNDCGSTPCSKVDATHPEFSGRVTLNTSTDNSRHATHVAGTMIAKGTNAPAKGMAPNASLQAFNASSITAMFGDKTNLGTLNVTADNNSWGFVFGWQSDGSGSVPWVWHDAIDYYGGYDSFISAPYDKIAIDPAVNVLFVHSSGNDGANGHPDLDTNSRHLHTDQNGDVVTAEIFCYSKNGSGADCPTPTCTPGNSTKATDDNNNIGAPHCETVKHKTYDAYGTMSLIAAEKNVLAVGACDEAAGIVFFSSRGPTTDGRVKPDLMAMGFNQYSTIPGGLYASMSGTSMSSPVVTGIAGVVAQQWKQTFNARPSAQQLKTLLIAGARDLVGTTGIDLPGPDYSYGFGLVDAKNSVDIIRADAGASTHIRTAAIGNGETVEIPLTITAAGNFRAVLAWADPEVPLPPSTDEEDPLADKTLVNDLDLKIVSASGNTTLPYVLDKNNPTAAATRGVNSVDNTEVVEIANAAPGSYKAVITGKSVPVNAPQKYVFVTTTATQGAPAAPCTDAFEPNDTPATATTLGDGQTLSAKACSGDTDWYSFIVNRSGTITINVTAKDTPLTVQLDSPGPTVVTSTTIPANTTQTLTTTLGSGNTFVPLQGWLVRVTPSGDILGDSSYTIKATFPAPVVGRFPGRRGH